MARIRGHETVYLESGDWIDLKDCDVLWRPFKRSAILSIHRWVPTGIWFAPKRKPYLLLKTPKGTLVTKSRIDPGIPFTSYRIAWTEVTPLQAFLWIQSMDRHGAKRLFPELHEQQQQHKLPGER